MKRLVSQYDEEYYTYMLKVLNSLGGRKLNYKWLITDIEAYPQDNGILDKLIEDNREYLLLTTEELMSYLEILDFQWVWAVFSAIPMEYTDKEILQYELPCAENYEIYKENPIIQHPLAQIEIVAQDASCFQITARDEEILCGLNDNYEHLFNDYKRLTDLFVNIDERTSSEFIEFQYCKMKRNILGKYQKAKTKLVCADSIYIHCDFFFKLIKQYRSFVTENSLYKGHYCYWSDIYYSKEETENILNELKLYKLSEDDMLVSWLEKAITEYNGFYILGI